MLHFSLKVSHLHEIVSLFPSFVTKLAIFHAKEVRHKCDILRCAIIFHPQMKD